MPRDCIQLPDLIDVRYLLAAIKRIDQLLEGKKWDLICFNFGLADQMYRDPRTKAVRAMSKEAGGVRVTPLKAYEANLRTLVRRFRATGAKLLWTSTMPLNPSSRSSVLDDASVAEYNAVAAKVMKERGVAVVDIHAQITKLLGKGNKRGRDRLHNQILKGDLSGPLVGRILEQLK